MTAQQQKQKAFKSFLSAAYSYQCHNSGITDDRKLSDTEFEQIHGFEKSIFDDVMLGIGFFVNGTSNEIIKSYIP